MNHKVLFESTILLFAVSCIPTETATIAPITPTVLPAEDTAIPSEQNGGTLLELPTPVIGTVALDFSNSPCSSSWSNNGEFLPCPGSLQDIHSGYVNRFDQVVIEGNIHIFQPGLLTIPAQQESGFYAIFGKYPPFTIQPGDRFKAVLACADSHPNCDVNFSLEYFDPDNTIQQVPNAKWNKKYAPEGTYIYADINLDALAGKTVQFLLTVRDNGNAGDDYAVWIMPHIARIGNTGTDAITPNQPNQVPVEVVNISGRVDMKSAPPYLYDDHPPGSLSTVVFFNLDRNIFFTVPTEKEHLNFSIDVFPGRYYALAYSQGSGDAPCVSGAYTGSDPSCGQPMAVISVFPNSPLSNVTINDWNWSCGGNATRMEKPEEVSLPD